MPSSPRKHRFGDVLPYEAGPPMMLVRRLDADEFDATITGGWEVARFRDDEVTFGPMFGLYVDRDQMLPQYTVVSDDD